MARSAKQTRPQLVCVLADNSGSMSGDKARAATQGIREMLMECQSKGDGVCFQFLLIRFDNNAKVDLTTRLSSGGAPVSYGSQKRFMPLRLLQRLVRRYIAANSGRA